jgi:hypothetical protein
MKTETRRGLVAAGAALIALITLATLSPLPQLLMWYLTNNTGLSLGVTGIVADYYDEWAGPAIYAYLVYVVGWSAFAAGLATFGIGAAIVIGVA